MCYIDLQHYIHCKHTNAQFRSCWNPSLNRISLESGDHNNFRAEIHSYDRLCGACYRDAIERATERTGQIIDRPWIEYTSRTQFTVHLEFKSSVEILLQNMKAGEKVPFGVNEDHGGRLVACMFDGGIDREKAVRKPRRAFRNRPTHIGKNGETVPAKSIEPLFISAKDARDVDCIHDECNTTTQTKEILLYFSACGHFNGLWCEELLEQDGDFVARCGCDRFDEKLATKQYAESAGVCLLCRTVRREEDRILLWEMVWEISDDKELALWPFGQRWPFTEVR